MKCQIRIPSVLLTAKYPHVQTGTRRGEKQEPVVKRKLHFRLLGSCICSFGSHWKKRPQGCGHWICFCSQLKRWGSIYLAASGRKWQRPDLSISPNWVAASPPPSSCHQRTRKDPVSATLRSFLSTTWQAKCRNWVQTAKWSPWAGKEGGAVSAAVWGLMAIRGSTALLLVETTDFFYWADPAESHKYLKNEWLFKSTIFYRNHSTCFRSVVSSSGEHRFWKL